MVGMIDKKSDNVKGERKTKIVKLTKQLKALLKAMMKSQKLPKLQSQKVPKMG